MKAAKPTMEVMKMSSLFPQYNTPLFTDVYNNEDDFLDDMNSIGIPAKLTENSATTLFYLLYARYGNSPIANTDVEQFKYKLFSTIFQYGPTWEKRLAIQDELHTLTKADIVLGGKEISNHAYNPGQAPSTASLEELTHINEQNVQTRKRSTIDAYRNLWSMLEDNVTDIFLDKFRYLFKTFVMPENPILYTEDC